MTFSINNSWSAKAVGGIAMLALVASMFATLVPAVALGATTGTLQTVANGTYTSWTGDESDVDETSNFDCSSNDVIKSTTPTSRESFTISLASIPDGATITSVDITVRDRGDASSGGTYKTFARLNGTDTDASSNLTATGGNGSPCSNTKTQTIDVPDTVKSGGTTLEIGVAKISGNNSAVRVGTMTATVTYTEAVVEPELCEDEAANNVGEELPCTYNPTPQSLCEDQGGTWNDGNCNNLAEEIVCDIFEQFPWLPLPDFCENEEDLTPEEQCDLDGGFWNGASCEELAVCDEDETYNSENNTCTPADNGGDEGGDDEDTDSTPAPKASKGGGGGGSIVYCSETRTTFCKERTGGGGEVLGASTDDMCSPLLTSYLRLGKGNNVGEVAKLQVFLNNHMSAGLTIDGFFGEATKAAVDAFQLKYATEVLAPWLPFGLAENTPTGYVYKTTQRMINNIHCATLNIPMPLLP